MTEDLLRRIAAASSSPSASVDASEHVALVVAVVRRARERHMLSHSRAESSRLLTDLVDRLPISSALSRGDGSR